MNLKEPIRSIWSSAPAPAAHTATKKYHIPIGTRARKLVALSVSLIGLVCLLFTDHVHDVLPYVLGVEMIGLGALDTLRGFLTKEHTRRETKLTANGITFLLLGIVMLVNRASADSLIGSIWGTLGLLKGSERLNEAIYCYTQKESSWGKFVHAAIELLLAFLLLLDPVSNIHHHLMILGLELITIGWEISREKVDA